MCVPSSFARPPEHHIAHTSQHALTAVQVDCGASAHRGMCVFLKEPVRGTGLCSESPTS
jgi:hypothetical protein